MIELRGVQVRCSGAAGTRLLFDGVDLDLAAGDVACVTGPSGSGKSTLLALLYGAVVPDRGQVRVFGHDVRRLRRSSIALLRRRLGIMPQDLCLFADRTALANVAIALEIRGQRARASRRLAGELLAEVGLADHAAARVRDLSRGQAQRVALARAFAGEPGLLVLDDPTSHQDDAGRELVAELIARRGGIVATNDPGLLEIATQRSWQRLELGAGILAADAARELPDGTGDGEIVTGQIDIDFEYDHDGAHGELVPFPRRSAGGTP